MLATLPSILKEEMKDLVDDMVGVQLELSKFKLMPLLFFLDNVSA